jgi:transcription termination factor NusB
MQNADQGTSGEPRRPGPAHRHRAGALQRPPSPTSWPKPASPNWLRSACSARHHPRHRARRARGAVALKAMADSDDYDALIAWAASSAARPTTSSWWPTRAAPASRGSRWTTRSRWPTPSSRSRTRPRPGPAPPTRAATPPAWRSRWPTCWTTCREHVPAANRPLPSRKAPQQAAPKSPRRRSREFALQGLYEWLLSPAPTPAVIDAHMREQDGFDKCDARTSTRCCTAASARPPRSTPCSRAMSTARPRELSPVEHGVLMIGAYELSTASTSLPRRHQRGGRTGQVLRRHRRPQVRQRRARQGCAADLRRPRWRPARLKAAP